MTRKKRIKWFRRKWKTESLMFEVSGLTRKDDLENYRHWKRGVEARFKNPKIKFLKFREPVVSFRDVLAWYYCHVIEKITPGVYDTNAHS